MSVGPISGGYIMLGTALILWCVVHSTLISIRVISAIKAKAGENYKYYRIFYNLFSMFTLLPILIYAAADNGPNLFSWDGTWRILQIGIVAISISLFITGGQRYDALQFLGVRQIKNTAAHKSLNAEGKLDTKGILSLVRHPWYSAAILIIWARDINTAVLIVNSIFSLYLIIGSYLEEKKLVLEFGESYREYQKNVSMLFPYKWIRSRLLL